tara:strand:+ start:1285 stop:1809 length:525 start_codon:yes stop_codon:yes gene_type:complete
MRDLIMLLNKKNIKNIKNKKITYIKNFTSITDIYDFNKISNLVDNYSLDVSFKPGQVSHFNSIWQLKDIHKFDNQFFTFMDLFRKIFKYTTDIKDGVDLFFSFITNTGGSHVDEEDVFLIGLHGKTIYRIIETNKDYCLEKGDLLHIPKGNRHKAISATPRSIASVGFFGGKTE